MGQKHADGDGVIRIIRVSERKRKIGVDVVIKIKEVLFVELHERGADNGLGDRCEDVDGVCRRLFFFWDVVGAVSLGPDDLVVVDDAGGQGSEPCDPHEKHDLLVEERVRQPYHVVLFFGLYRLEWRCRLQWCDYASEKEKDTKDCYEFGSYVLHWFIFPLVFFHLARTKTELYYGEYDTPEW